MFWLKILTNFIKIMREGQTPAQVAGGFAFGSILGLSPMFTLQGMVVWIIILILDVNLSAVTLALMIFGLFAFIFDPLFHQLGYYLLVQIDGLREMWIALYNAPIAPLTRFNNTVVMGSFVAAIILFPAIYFGMKKFVIAYRTTIGARIEKMKIYQVISKSWIVQTYQKIRSLGGVL